MVAINKSSSFCHRDGPLVWRTVVSRYAKWAADTLRIVVEDEDGNRNTVVATFEHPFHVEDWDATTGDLVAALDGTAGLPAHIAMPTDGSTPFGDWGKAGALKVGDTISTVASVTGEVGPTKTNALLGAAADDQGAVALDRMISAQDLSALGIEHANDDRPATIIDILRTGEPTRVWSFGVESQPGEVTHNYLIGDDGLWVHNLGGNPFRGKSPWQIEQMFRTKGFVKVGKGGEWLNPRTNRKYFIDLDCNSYEGFPHVDIKYRKRAFVGPGGRWPKKRLPFGG